MKQISIIVAIAENLAIGKDNDLLWHISDDLKRFKRITKGHQVIMGKNTYISLPFKPLPNRTNIVITDNRTEIFEGCKTAYSIEEALSYCNEKEESFIIGGASIYSQFFPHANKLYLTQVNKEFDADTFFREIDFEEWRLIEKEVIETDDSVDFTYSYETYVRRE